MAAKRADDLANRAAVWAFATAFFLILWSPPFVPSSIAGVLSVLGMILFFASNPLRMTSDKEEIAFSDPDHAKVAARLSGRVTLWILVLLAAVAAGLTAAWTGLMPRLGGRVFAAICTIVVIAADWQAIASRKKYDRYVEQVTARH